MKKILALLIGINLAIGMVFFGMFYLTETYPFHPGESLYSLQDLAESWRLRLTARGEKQANMAIALAERRLADLAQADSHKKIDAAIIAFDDALVQATAAVNEITSSPGNRNLTFPQLELLYTKTRLVLYAIEKVDDCDLVVTLRLKVDQALAEGDDITPEKIMNNNVGPLLIDAEVVSFLGQDVDHEVYPLLGKHQEIECIDCHLTGKYINTPTQCGQCHKDFAATEVSSAVLVGFEDAEGFSPDNPYPNHFEGTCDECHNEESWEPTNFDHRGVKECFSCHAEEATNPESETYDIHSDYPQLCIACHKSVESWEEVVYDHAGVTECISCHAAEEPSHHYTNLPCEGCHSDTENWNTYIFDHATYTDCLTCHESPGEHYVGTCNTCHRNTSSWMAYDFIHIALSDCQTCHVLEKDHFTGQCSNCHTKDAWKPANFRHVGYSMYQCVSCHQKDAPANHYGNTCGKCHNTISWSQKLFDHSGNTPCTDCHAGDTPANHYGNTCQKCHTTSTWKPYTFDHAGFYDCNSCHSAPSGHYTGVCSNCHNTSRWGDISFSHQEVSTKCQDCHDSPSGHWPGQCGNCHISTNQWETIKFDHSGGYSDCKACHSDERPSSPHPSIGQCSKCHSTDGWLPVNATSTPKPTNTPAPTNTPTPTSTLPPTNTPTPTNTLPPSNTPLPTSTGTVTAEPTSTNTPIPTDTPVPTNTPIPPTNTPIPPTDTPEPTPTPHGDGEECSACHH